MTDTEGNVRTARTGWARLGIGLVQGIAAAALIETAETAFATAHPMVFAAMAMVVAFPPLILLAGLGRMPARTLAAWTLAAAAILASLAAYDLWREPVERAGSMVRVWPTPQMLFFAAVATFVAHHLIEPADVERRLFASYRERFESASRHAFQLILSLGFTLILFGVLHLGAGLFGLIGIKLLKVLLNTAWFVSPIMGTAFAAAVHLTDVRPQLIRGVRTIGLLLLSWLLPIMAGLTAAFLVALVFTGVGPLWATRNAAALMLSAAAVLVVLINAAYQDGEDVAARPTPMRWAMRGAGLLLVPLVTLAAWANALRVGQYGLTPERTTAVLMLVVAAVFALGYAVAAVVRGPLMRRIETVNVAAAVVGIAVVLAALSPLADPARLSVLDQIRRLETGAAKADAFDFHFLRWDSTRFGREALARLSRSSDPAVASRARQALADTERYAPARVAGAPLSEARITPEGASLPQGFREQVFTGDEAGSASGCLIGGGACTIRPLDVTGDGQPEVLVETGIRIDVLARQPDGRWRRIGGYSSSACGVPPSPLLAGALTLAPPAVLDLQFAGRRLSFMAEDRCEKRPSPRPDRAARPPQNMGPAFDRP